MKPIRKTYSLTLDADGIAASQTPAGAGDLTIDGDLASGGSVALSVGQHVSITSAGDDSGRTFTVYGTDNAGASISEAITGANVGAATGSKNFKTITRVAVDDATANAVTVGVLGTAELPWIPLDLYRNPFSVAYQVDIGTATYRVESTLDDVQNTAITPAASATLIPSTSVDASGNSDVVAKAIRLVVTAFTSGDILFRVAQAGR
jgi:hypothetical protein